MRWLHRLIIPTHLDLCISNLKSLYDLSCCVFRSQFRLWCSLSKHLRSDIVNTRTHTTTWSMLLTSHRLLTSWCYTPDSWYHAQRPSNIATNTDPALTYRQWQPCVSLHLYPALAQRARDSCNGFCCSHSWLWTHRDHQQLPHPHQVLRMRAISVNLLLWLYVKSKKFLVLYRCLLATPCPIKIICRSNILNY